MEEDTSFSHLDTETAFALSYGALLEQGHLC